MMLRGIRRRQKAPWLVDRLSGPLGAVESLLFDDPDRGLAVVDRAGRILRLNAWLVARTAERARAVPGRRVSGLFAEADVARVKAFVDRALREPAAPAPLRAVLATAGGMPVLLSARGLREPDQGISGLLLRVADLSVQDGLEQQSRHAHKMQALGQLAAGVAHDFNNLLTGILASAETALERPGLDAPTRDDLEHVRLAGQRGAALVRQLLTFSRHQPVQPEAVEVNAAIRALATLLPRVLGSGWRLALDLEEPGRWVHLDPSQLDQVVVNLATNARNAMPSGGTIGLRTSHRTLYAPMDLGGESIPAGRYVSIEVSDSGAGIPAALRQRMFEPFFTTRPDAGGTGLGLATVQAIARRAGGFVTVDSAMGRGSRIAVHLPRLEVVRDPGDGVEPADQAVSRYAESGPAGDAGEVRTRVAYGLI